MATLPASTVASEPSLCTAPCSVLLTVVPACRSLRVKAVPPAPVSVIVRAVLSATAVPIASSAARRLASAPSRLAQVAVTVCPPSASPTFTLTVETTDPAVTFTLRLVPAPSVSADEKLSRLVCARAVTACCEVLGLMSTYAPSGTLVLLALSVVEP